MVKDISATNQQFVFGLITISADDLIAAIERLNFETVTARNNDTEFESLDDMKAHKSLLVGTPIIRCDKVSLYLSRGDARTESRYEATPTDISKAKALCAELKSRRGYIDIYSSKLRYVLLTQILYFTFYIIYGNFGKKLMEEKTFTIVDNIFTIIGLIILFLTLYCAFHATFLAGVYHRPIEGFFKRNFDKIVIGVLTSLIGAAIGYYSKS